MFSFDAVCHIYVLWELLQPITFYILAHLGYGLRYYKCNQKACMGPFPAGFSPQFPAHREDCESLLSL